MRSDVLTQPGRHGLGNAKIDVETLRTKFVGKAPHRSDDEMKSLSMPATRPYFVEGNDHEHSVRRWCGVCERTDAAIELIAEDPHGVRCGHGSRR
jgi:hypothetical protein